MTVSRNADLTARAIAASDHLGEALAELTAIIAAIRDGLSMAVEGADKPALHAPETCEETLAANRRAHRSGRPGKIEGDPELEAFIAARIDILTFAEVSETVAASFPPDRRTSTSAVHRWWQKRQTLTVKVR